MSYSSPDITYCVACTGGQAQYQASSQLEVAIQKYQPLRSEVKEEPAILDTTMETPTYQQKEYATLYSKLEDYTPSGFVESFIDFSQPAVFVGDDELRTYVEKAFELMTGKQFPEDISVHILTEQQLKEVHECKGGTWNKNIQGFAINRKGFTTSDIFIKKDRLDSMLLTIGHEIGHVMSMTLPNIVDEEAKAFAFSLAWMDVIQDNNIANIQFKQPNPAKNGIHDKAFSFVLDQINKGKQALQIFTDLMKLKCSSEV